MINTMPLQTADKGTSASSAAPRQANTMFAGCPKRVARTPPNRGQPKQSLAVVPLPSICTFLASLFLEFFDKLGGIEKQCRYYFQEKILKIFAAFLRYAWYY
ncbi:MAG: hypothetical protein ACI4JY_04615 [Oscillospiraceae bacterium]